MKIGNTFNPTFRMATPGDLVGDLEELDVVAGLGTTFVSCGGIHMVERHYFSRRALIFCGAFLDLKVPVFLMRFVEVFVSGLFKLRVLFTAPWQALSPVHLLVAMFSSKKLKTQKEILFPEIATLSELKPYEHDRIRSASTADERRESSQERTGARDGCNKRDRQKKKEDAFRANAERLKAERKA